MSRLLFAVALVVAALSGSTANASQNWTECMGVFPEKNFTPFEVQNSVRICRAGVLAISYDVDMVNPALSMYYVTPEQARNLLPGRASFYEDPDLNMMDIQQAGVRDNCFNNQFNRGHLAPNHIMSSTTIGKKSCFSMANIAPQGIQFNGGCWNQMEKAIVDWIASNKALHIITGVSYLDRKKTTRSKSGVAYPDYFFTAICDVRSGESTGFYGVNSPSTTSNTNFVTVSKIEQMYGGRLFPDNLCNVNKVNASHWWVYSSETKH